MSLSFQHVFEPGSRDPVLLLLHGTGADERDLLPLGRAIAPGRALLSPLGKVREHGAPRWFRRHAEGVFDEDDIKLRAAELAAFLPEAARAYDLPPDRFVAVGFSNGANMAAALLLLHPRALRGAILLRATTPLVPQTPPDLSGVPAYLAAGARDPMIPPVGARGLAALLSKAGADVTLRVVDAGHGLLPAEVADARGWLAERKELS